MKHTSMSSRLNLSAARLRAACKAHDWVALAREDRQLRALADQLTAHANWQAAEYRALDGVKAEIRATLGMIAEEKQKLADEMAEFNRHRSAWVAYAKYDDAQDMTS
ncbi:hypothetical protein EO087_10075 [Dyella sp. M7H15-1]|uniref:hypothetical protein n=1 Tax=Dyella sp. M7H15-1 TaxID=2501295 RepID=UPI0010050201|nr:hypothetical protein [Dyella sp. M7H15-1]QAU24295.1 hypothetical protein EO087_10075 [Dyella sp. M7H15-1]